MKSKIFTYSTNEVEVSWDMKRCIHAKECVNGLPEVFDITKKPWIDPEQSDDVSKLTNIIHKCPSGALQYRLLNSDEKEMPPPSNTLTITNNGPIYLQGDLHVVNAEGETLLKETRMAMCRCGKSSNKPFCDNSHIEADFQCGTSYNPERLELEPATKHGGELIVKLITNGAFVVDGTYVVQGDEAKTETSKRMSYCRCGHSSNPPFCDSTHRSIGFEA